MTRAAISIQIEAAAKVSRTQLVKHLISFAGVFFQYKVVAGSLIGNGGSTPMEVGGDGEEADVDITMEKLEAEAREVRQFTQDGFSRAVLQAPPQISQSSSAQRQSNKFRQD